MREERFGDHHAMRASNQQLVEHDQSIAAALDDPQEILRLILDPTRRGTLYPYLHLSLIHISEPTRPY